MLYYTNSVGISAAFLGTLMFLSRILDAVSDVVMGAVMEKTKSRWGKARPWLLWSLLPMTVLMFLMFYVPNSLSDLGKNVYVSVTYILGIVVCMTIILMGYHATMTKMCVDSVDRGILYAIVPVIANIFLIFVTISVPYLLNYFGGNTSQKAWLIVTGIICVGYLIFTFAGFLMVKEHTDDEVNTQSTEVKKIPLWQQIKVALFNKYFVILLILGTCIWGASGVQGSANIYYTTYVLHSDAAFSFVTFASYFPGIIMAPFCVGLFQKFGKKRVTLVGLTISVICRGLIILQPYNAVWFVVFTFLASLAQAPVAGMVFSLAGDVSEYGFVKHGIRADALSSSALSFATKVGVGVGSAILGWGLAIGQFNNTVTVQADNTILALIVIELVVPAFMYLIALIGIGIWDIDKKIAEEKAKNS